MWSAEFIPHIDIQGLRFAVIRPGEHHRLRPGAHPT